MAATAVGNRRGRPCRRLPPLDGARDVHQRVERHQLQVVQVEVLDLIEIDARDDVIEDVLGAAFSAVNGVKIIIFVVINAC